VISGVENHLKKAVRTRSRVLRSGTSLHAFTTAIPLVPVTSCRYRPVRDTLTSSGLPEVTS